MLPAGHWPATSWVHYTTSCNTQSSAPEDGKNNFPKHVELTGIVNKPLLLHLVGCLYYLYQWCTVKQISDNEIYLLIKYIKSVLWRVVKLLSYIEDARCLNVKIAQSFQLHHSHSSRTRLLSLLDCWRPLSAANVFSFKSAPTTPPTYYQRFLNTWQTVHNWRQQT